MREGAIFSVFLATILSPWTPHSQALSVGPRIPINEQFSGLHKVHSNPDIFLIEDFLDTSSCRDLITQAKNKKMSTSPVAYAGWTTDFQELIELAAKGPVSWLSIIGAWLQVKDDPAASQIDLVLRILQNFAVLLSFAVVGVGAFVWSRAEGLKTQRTSTSTTLDDLTEEEGGTATFVKRATELFGDGSVPAREQAALFEAPTVIRYESGQVLKPHFDANRSAETEDANRGGQTLATLLVYLNDVPEGGLTRFGRLPSPTLRKSAGAETKLTVKPKLGDALLFFPADARGNFDERTEHEGCPAVDEKWIARIWRHQNRVPPPFGLADDALARLR